MAKVRLIAVNPKYRTLPFFCVPVYDDVKRAFKTGQEDLTPEQLAKEPLILDPEKQYAVRHMQDFDTNKRKDAIMLDLIKTQDTIAHKSADVVPSRHLFYIQDIEAEAGENVTKMDRMFEALSLVKQDTSLGRQKDIAIFLGISINQPVSVIQERIYNKCQNEPDEVIEFFDSGSINKLFAMKLRNYGIVQLRDGKYVDNELFIGRSIEELVHYIQDSKNEAVVTKWGYKLDKIEGNIQEPSNKPVSKKDAGSEKADMSLSNVPGNKSNGSEVKEEEQIKVDKGQPDKPGSSPNEEEEILSLRKTLDEMGINYHHMHKAEKLRSLIEENK